MATNTQLALALAALTMIGVIAALYFGNRDAISDWRRHRRNEQRRRKRLKRERR